MILKILGYLIVLSLAGCIYLVLKKHTALRGAEQFRGTVIGHLPRRGSKGRTVYALQIEYRSKGGALKHFVPAGASSPAARPIGAELVVFEYPDHNQTPDILLFEELYLFYWMWFCVGFAVLGCLAAPSVLQAIYVK